jgi:hypothetical protein
LSTDDVATLEALLPRGAIEGDRYSPDQMRHLDSEK